MPKEKTSIAYKLKQAVKNNKYLRTEGDVRICTICEKKINFSHQHGSQRLSEHLKSRNHLQKVDIKDKPKTQTLLRDVFNCEQSTSNDQTQFNKDMTKAFLSADIPFHKLNNFYFKNFLKKYIDFAIPEESTLRKNYTKDVYEDTLQKIRNTIGEKDIFLMIDETTDVESRYVFNVLVGKLDGEPVKAMLLVTFLSYRNN